VSETRRPLEPEPERRARMRALNRRKLEALARGPGEHTVTVEVALDWENQGRLGELLAGLGARLEFPGPAVGAEANRRVVGVTVTVKARTEKAAQEIVTVAVLDEMELLGLV
jgi:hypothetical protein